MPQYIIIGGGAYQPGSAAAKRAQELYNQWKANQPPATPTPATPGPRTPSSSIAPSSFPSYANTGGASAGGTSSVGGLMGSTLFGGGAMTGQGAFGLVPATPNPLATAGSAIAGNQANLNALSTLGTDTTKLSAGLAQLPLQLNLPNYMGNLGQLSANVASNLAGRISAPTTNEITRAAAERGVGIGSAPGSPNAQTNWMGVLGQTSEQLQALGANQLQQMIAGTPTGQPFNIAGQQTTPGDLQYWQDVANIRGAAPDPAAAAQANLDMLLKSIEAGKVQGFPGYGGGGGGGGIPRTTFPGGNLSPVSPVYYYSGGVPSGGYGSNRIAPIAPGMAPTTTYPTYDTPGAYPYNPLAPEGTIGESVFDPNSLGGYQFGGGLNTGGYSNPMDLGGYNYSPGTFTDFLEDPQDFGVYNPFAGYNGL